MCMAGYWPTQVMPSVGVLPGHSVVGTCSKCHGPVTVPGIWGGIIPPTPTCARCGAKKRESHGPIIDME